MNEPLEGDIIYCFCKMSGPRLHTQVICMLRFHSGRKTEKGPVLQFLEEEKKWVSTGKILFSLEQSCKNVKPLH